MVPGTFWKDHVFKKYKRGEIPGWWVMTNENRKKMRANIEKMTPTHEGKRFKDPSKSNLKGLSFRFVKEEMNLRKSKKRTNGWIGSSQCQLKPPPI